MTSARQERKQYRAFLAALVWLVALLCAGPGVLRAAATQAIVVDRHTGLAIGGYDPVAFYTEGRPLLGKPDLELSYGGATWRFRDIGNREAFAAHPNVYMPQFGGYDPIGIAHGLAVAGNPNVWLIAGERLFLFYDRARLEKFAADAERLSEAAERKWPAVLRTLGP